MKASWRFPISRAERQATPRAADEVVRSQIESWQSVFGGKHVTIPV
jgi:hypothetical protein